MMNNMGLMISFIVLANVIALGILFAFTKRQEGRQRLLTIAFSYVAMYVVALIVYALSGIGMNETTHDALAGTVPLVLVPVNVIVVMPFFFKWLAKYQAKEMKAEVFQRNLIILALILLVLCVGEFFYVRDIQNNTSEIAKRATTSGGINSEVQDNTNEQTDGVKGKINSPMQENVNEVNEDVNGVNAEVVNGVEQDTNVYYENVNSANTNSTTSTNQQKITYQVVTEDDEVKNVNVNGTVQEDNSGRVY